jgi:hypothetical protein
MFTFGTRVCDGNVPECVARHAAGGWGPIVPGDTGNWIPNRNVYFYNNVLVNPPGFASPWQHFVISGPVTPPAGTNVSDPAVSDANLQIRGNFIANGSADLALIGSYTATNGCPSTNTLCNEAQISADNTINAGIPALVDAANGDFHPAFGAPSGESLLTHVTYAIPDFAGGDAPLAPLVPSAQLGNGVDTDFDRRPRTRPGVVGAFTGP